MHGGGRRLIFRLLYGTILLYSLLSTSPLDCFTTYYLKARSNSSMKIKKQPAELQIKQHEFEQHLFATSEEDKRISLPHQVKEKTRNRTTKKDEQNISSARSKDSPADTEQRRKVLQPYLYDNKQSHPIIEYKPTREEIDSSAITPSFVLEVTWPRVVEFYHPSSPRCTEFQSTYISVARGIKRLSSRLPVQFHAVNCARYREVCKYGFNVESVPKLIGLKSGSIDWSELEISSDFDENELVQYIADAINVPLDEVKRDTAIANVESELDDELHSQVRMSRSIANSLLLPMKATRLNKPQPIPLSEQVFHDAMTSFVVTLTSSLYSQLPHGSVLPPDTSTVLREFIDLMRWAFPPETQAQQLAQHLAEEYFEVSTSEESLLNVIGKYVNNSQGMSWSEKCGGMNDSHDGYSCGLWSLLHILSLGVAERHDAVVGDVDRLSVSYAGHIMRSFIDRFFIHCEACRQLWTTLYDEACCELDNSDHSIAEKTKLSASIGGQEWKSLAFWVWEIHNEISVRTKHNAGKEYYSKYSRIASTNLLWPSPSECPRCWKSTHNGSMTSMNAYDRDAIYNHLKKIYWPIGVHNNRHILLDKWTKAKRHLSMQHLRKQMESHQGLTLNVMLLGACLLWLLLARYRHQTTYRKKKSMKHRNKHNEDDCHSPERIHMQRPRDISSMRIKQRGFRSRYPTNSSRRYQLNL